MDPPSPPQSVGYLLVGACIVVLALWVAYSYVTVTVVNLSIFVPSRGLTSLDSSQPDGDFDFFPLIFLPAKDQNAILCLF